MGPSLLAVMLTSVLVCRHQPGLSPLRHPRRSVENRSPRDRHRSRSTTRRRGWRARHQRAAARSMARWRSDAAQLPRTPLAGLKR
jgi:two-component system sensor histidine kinase TctE